MPEVPGGGGVAAALDLGPAQGDLAEPVKYAEDAEHEEAAGQGSEKWIAQIAALLEKMPFVGQIGF